MQSYLQRRRIYKQLERQIVVKHEGPEDVWTYERRYWYPEGGGLSSDPRDPDNGAAAERRREHGHHTRIGGPTLAPRHTARLHLEPEGDAERADIHPDFQADPYTINTRDSIGGRVDMMVTGVERARPGDEQSNATVGTASDELHDRGTDTDSIDEKDRIIVVTYEGDTDPMDPHNWSLTTRCLCTTLLSLLGAITLWSSTIDATALVRTKILYHTSFELETVPTALYLILLGAGGIIAAPVSEVIGRNPVYISCTPLFMLFEMGSGLAQNVTQRIVCRALCGLFGSAPLVCSAGALVDLWSQIERVYVFPFYAIVAFLGATTGPAPGSVIVWVHAVSWRFVDWMTIIMAGIILALTLLFLPETYSPVILQWKARQLRRLTGDERYRAPAEFRSLPVKKRILHALYRPLLMLWSEPIIMMYSGYQSIIFIVLYTFSAGYVDIFEKVYKLNQGQAGVAFLSFAVGVVLSAAFIPVSMKLVRRDIHRCRAKGHLRPEPEYNLYLGMIGAPFIPISLFWLGWTAKPSISMWSGLGAAVVFGFSVLCAFVSTYQYITATFEKYPASALASIQLMRLTAAGVMAVLARIMYKNLGIPWCLTLLGLIATVFLPVPYLLYIWGWKVRQWSRHALSEHTG
ncbi:hypothetical protein N7462_007276 [Penicillium macrosclerotiorum]|uniref:uncharacterized protein n=1 Tax=Penicillium macrosclerotiorum TaxID=303699 RepID=UPI0025479F69|nr:uncharacterized protein N7462_007276 [Penicillium macrosclerotiorum]KAJ5679032.1 hypothetical protein N7462_007276 [Penicillium macrosclerotiorum]